MMALSHQRRADAQNFISADGLTRVKRLGNKAGRSKILTCDLPTSGSSCTVSLGTVLTRLYYDRGDDRVNEPLSRSMAIREEMTPNTR